MPSGISPYKVMAVVRAILTGIISPSFTPGGGRKTTFLNVSVRPNQRFGLRLPGPCIMETKAEYCFSPGSKTMRIDSGRIGRCAVAEIRFFPFFHAVFDEFRDHVDLIGPDGEIEMADFFVFFL